MRKPRVVEGAPRTGCANGSRVQLDVPAIDPRVILELPPRRPERVGDRDVDVLVGEVAAGIARDRDRAIGDRQLDPDMEGLAVPLAAVRLLDDDGAAHDAAVRAVEPIDPALHRRLDGRAR